MVNEKIIEILDDFQDFNSRPQNNWVVIITNPLSITFAKVAKAKMEVSLNSAANTLGAVAEMAQVALITARIKETLKSKPYNSISESKLPLSEIYKADMRTFSFGFSLLKGFWVMFESPHGLRKIYTHRRNQRILKLLISGLDYNTTALKAGLNYRKIKFFLLAGFMLLFIIFVALHIFYPEQTTFLNVVGEKFNDFMD